MTVIVRGGSTAPDEMAHDTEPSASRSTSADTPCFAAAETLMPLPFRSAGRTAVLAMLGGLAAEVRGVDAADATCSSHGPIRTHIAAAKERTTAVLFNV
jgi:hypothetical protein